MTKYKAKAVYACGMRFASKAEFRRYEELKMMERAGLISNLEAQKPYVLIDKSKYGRAIKYIADYVYQEGGKLVVEDVKSEPTKTPLYKLKKRLMAERYGIIIKELEKKK